MRKFFVALAAVFITFSAQASFEGATVQATYYFPDLNTIFDQQQAVVGPGVEFPNFPAGDPRTNVDISAFNIYITYNSASIWTGASFNGEFFEGQTPIPPIVSVAINGATNMAGLDAGRISFTQNSVSINWNGLGFTADTIVSLDVQFGEIVAVPTIGTLSKLAMVLLILAFGFLSLRRYARGRSF